MVALNGPSFSHSQPTFGTSSGSSASNPFAPGKAKLPACAAQKNEGSSVPYVS